jgi:hypothetical protein
MATPFQLLMKLQRQLEYLKTMNTLVRQWRYIMDEYNQEGYAWYDFEANCDDWYIYRCHLWDENHFHILYVVSTPPYIENINVTTQ